MKYNYCKDCVDTHEKDSSIPLGYLSIVKGGERFLVKCPKCFEKGEAFKIQKRSFENSYLDEKLMNLPSYKGPSKDEVEKAEEQFLESDEDGLFFGEINTQKTTEALRTAMKFVEKTKEPFFYTTMRDLMVNLADQTNFEVSTENRLYFKRLEEAKLVIFDDSFSEENLRFIRSVKPIFSITEAYIKKLMLQGKTRILYVTEEKPQDLYENKDKLFSDNFMKKVLASVLMKGVKYEFKDDIIKYNMFSRH